MSNTSTSSKSLPAAAVPSPDAAMGSAEGAFMSRLANVLDAAEAEDAEHAPDAEDEAGGEAEGAGDEARQLRGLGVSTDDEADADDEDAETEAPKVTDERAEKLRAIAELERRAVHKKNKLAKREQEFAEKLAHVQAREAQLAEQATRIKALEQMFQDPDALLQLIEERVGPEKLTEYFVHAKDPDKIAERKARAAANGVTERVKALEAQLEQERQQRAQYERQIQSENARRAAEQSLMTRIGEVVEEAPHVAKWAERRPTDLLALAKRIDGELAQKGLHYNFDDIIIRAERQLSELYSEVYSAPQHAGAAGTSKERSATRIPAKVTGKTLSNRLAAERSVVRNQTEELEGLSFDERVRRLKSMHGA